MDIRKNKERLIKKLMALKPFLYTNLEGKKTYIRKYFKEVEHPKISRIYELVIIPPGQATGWMNVTTMKVMVVGIKGEGLVESSKPFMKIHIPSKTIWGSEVLLTKIESQVQLYCYSEEAARSGGLYWINVSNNSDEDLHVLFVKKLETWVKA